MRNILPTLLPVAIFLCVFVLPGNAALVGTSVNGSLTLDGDPSNYFDPGYGFVPATDLNISGTTVTISNSAVEFGYDDVGSVISADFSDNRLTITDLIGTPETNNSFRMIFTDPAFSSQSLFTVSDSFPITARSLVGDVITLDYAGGPPTVGQTLTATFDIAPSPEPATLGLFFISGLATLGMLFARSRRAKIPELVATASVWAPPESIISDADCGNRNSQ